MVFTISSIVVIFVDESLVPVPSLKTITLSADIPITKHNRNVQISKSFLFIELSV